jgi:hypothetical protein
MSDIMLQPPFSKEKPYVDQDEKRTYKKLISLLHMYPTTWIMTTEYNAVQGFNTFMLADLAQEFASPSPDFREEYKYIIDRNPLFAENKQDTSINSISSGHLTLTDPRFEKLGVRYFISDRLLKKYKLLEEKDGRYIYENEWALPIYRIVVRDSMSSITPQYTDPNTWKFQIDESAIGGELQMVMNPGGLVATLNGKRVSIKKEKFLIRVPITAAGTIVVRYSPVEHLIETLKNKSESLKAPKIP